MELESLVDGGGEREPSIGKGLRCHGDRLSIEPLIEYWFHVMQRGVEGGGDFV